MLQKVAPRFLIMEGDSAGGSKEQPRQFLLEQGEFL
jgi:DNA gyrase/topoisomerase IV subunit B